MQSLNSSNFMDFILFRGLAIGGPGSRIYSVPESTDLESLALKQQAQARHLQPEGILVARGPAIYYNEP